MVREDSLRLGSIVGIGETTSIFKWIFDMLIIVFGPSRSRRFCRAQ